jgi:hypothetical protein
VLLDGVNHIAWISKDVARLGRFYQEVFDAEVGPTRAHGQSPFHLGDRGLPARRKCGAPPPR